MEIKIRYGIETEDGIQEYIFNIEDIENGLPGEMGYCNDPEIIYRDLYTGYKDKDGKEIYENDIVEHSSLWDDFEEGIEYNPAIGLVSMPLGIEIIKKGYWKDLEDGFEAGIVFYGHEGEEFLWKTLKVIKRKEIDK